MLRLLTTADTEILAAAHARHAARRRLPRGPLREPEHARGPRRVHQRRGRRRRPPARRPPRVAGGRERAAQPLRAATGTALILLGGEAEPDAELAELSPRPRGRRRAGLRVPAPRRRRQHARAAALPGRHVRAHGLRLRGPAAARGRRLLPREPRARRPPARRRRLLPLALRHRQHGVRRRAGHRDRGRRRPGRLPSGRTRLRGDAPALKLLDGEIDALITTVLASGGSHAGDEWHAEALEALDVPVIQALCATTSRQRWAESDSGLTPLDAAMQVAIPEFDGRIIGVPISFKEPIADAPFEALHYAPDLERCGRLARLAVNHARLRTLDRERAADRRSCSARSRPSTRGSATRSASTRPPARWCCCAALQEAGHRVEHDFANGDELIHALIADRRPRPGVPLRPPARAGHRAALGRRLHRVVQLAARRAARSRWSRPGARRPASTTSTATTS